MNSIKQSYDVVILGGGAGGLFCALTAAKKGRKVLVLEKSNKVGKKILMSGGGRCNFTNQFINPSNFLSTNNHFCKSALSQYTAQDFISMVEDHDIEYEEKKHGQLFCVNSAKDIVAMLVAECDKYKVKILTHANTTSVKHIADNSYDLKVDIDNKTENLSFEVHSRNLVVATGALSVPTLGGSGFGYDIAKQFELKITNLQAGLVPFMFSDYIKNICETLSGVSHGVEVTSNEVTFNEDMLFTHRGLSGPAILQISNYWNLGDSVSINLMPSILASDYIKSSKNDNPKLLLKTILANKMAKALVSELENLLWKEFANKPIGEWSNHQIEETGFILNNWILKPSSTEGYRTAEVTLGGVNTDSVSSKTMEVKNKKGLYFIGEVLDVTGHLGGFNFQWAWASAYVAGNDL
jgi:predicted Rossmann fold flavoprotein